MKPSFFDRRAFTILTGCWLVACTLGTLALWEYKATPCAYGKVPPHWPDAALLSRQVGQSELLMFAHPRCPCMRASLDELSVVLASQPHFKTIRVVFSVPDNSSREWLESEAVQQAKAIPGVEVVFDAGGRQSALFGAQTAGHTVLYDEAGELRFSGGITGLRGHTGPNMGRVAVTALGQNSQSAARRSPVFGCKLVGAARKKCCRQSRSLP